MVCHACQKFCTDGKRGSGVVLFSVLATLPGDVAGFLTNITAIDVNTSGATPIICLATAQGGGLSAYDLGATGLLSLQATHAYNPATQPVAAMSLVTVDLAGGRAILPIGLSDTKVVAYGLGTDGSLLSSAPTILTRIIHDEAAGVS
jgi:hypothetical protein